MQINFLLKYYFLFFSFVFGSVFISQAQITGGQEAFSFLKLSQSPHISALGGYTPSALDDDVSFTSQNPALLNPAYHNQLAVSYNSFFAGIHIANMQYAYHLASIKTDVAIGVQYLNYGDFQHTDIYGNILGDIKAADFSLQLAASRKYLKHWRYGAQLKVAGSNLGGSKASAALADVGIQYLDTTHKLSIGLVAKNMGFMIEKYNSQNKAEPLPFDLQLGITKQLNNVPLRLSMVAHHLYQWDIRYNNPADINNNIFGTTDTLKEGKHFADKLFRHFNFGAEFIIAKRITISGSYSHLRRSELGYGESKGAAGFSFGAGIYLNKFHVRYARSNFATAGAYNEFGLSIYLNKLFNIGKKTKAWGWHLPTEEVSATE